MLSENLNVLKFILHYLLLYVCGFHLIWEKNNSYRTNHNQLRSLAASVCASPPTALATFSTTNPTLTSVWLNPYFRYNSPSTSFLSYGTTTIIVIGFPRRVRKVVAISDWQSCMSVCLTARVEYCKSQWTACREEWHFMWKRIRYDNTSVSPWMVHVTETESVVWEIRDGLQI